MTRRKSKSRRGNRTRVENKPSGGQSSVLFPNLNRLAEEIREAQSQFERLNAENRRLRERLDQQDQELARVQQQATDLKAECESLKRDVELAEAEVNRSRTDALVSLFKDMADERHNRLLRKLLAFDDKEPKLLLELAHYLKDDLNLILEGEIGTEITLTEENLDRYELQEAVTSPCRAKIIGRGILFEGQIILRTEVEPVDVEEETNDGD
jgi:chromosome segregation ATPase